MIIAECMFDYKVILWKKRLPNNVGSLEILDLSDFMF
nr:MAG TPA: hypothetical protein [Caudoviricetes sp.]